MRSCTTRIHLLVRGEDSAGRYAGVSRIGLAVSTDGESFDVEPEPVLSPGDDEWQTWEGAGGCEDPRVVEAPDGGYVCTYTGFDGKSGTLMVATSDRSPDMDEARPCVRRHTVCRVALEERRDPHRAL